MSEPEANGKARAEDIGVADEIEERFDDNHKATYYYNPKTQISSWVRSEVETFSPRKLSTLRDGGDHKDPDPEKPFLNLPPGKAAPFAIKPETAQSWKSKVCTVLVPYIVLALLFLPILLVTFSAGGALYSPTLGH